MANAPAQPLPKDALIGKVVAGNFRVQEVIGIGAMGKVYKAEQISLGKLVALKVLHRHLLGDVNLAKRFHREAQAASRLNHRNSIQIVDFGQSEDGALFIAMEFLDGKDLLRTIRDEFPFTSQRIVHVLAQVCDALDEAHHQGIIHRDLKPENIMLTHARNEGDVVKVCDFGIAKVTDPKSGGASLDVSLTMAGIVCGTPEYMSPEQARGEKLDARTDLYSLGVILYQMLSGELPFKAESALGVVTKHLTEQPIPPHVLKPQLPIDATLEALCLRAMTKTRDERPATANDFKGELLAAIGGSLGAPSGSGPHSIPRSMTGDRPAVSRPMSESHPTGVGELGPLPRVRNRGTIAAVIVGAALLLAAGVAGAIFFATGDGGTNSTRTSSARDDDDKNKRDDDRDDRKDRDRVDAKTAAPEDDHGSATPGTGAAGTAVATALEPITAKVGPDKKKDKKHKDDKVKTAVPSTAVVVTTPAPATGGLDAPKARTAKTVYDEGMELFGKGNCTSAIPLFREATMMSPTFAEAYREMGKCYTRLGKLDAAIPHYKKYLVLKPTAPDAAAYKTIIKNHEESKGSGSPDSE